VVTPNTKPASKRTTGTAAKPATAPQPATKPATATAPQPATKPATATAPQPATKPATATAPQPATEIPANNQKSREQLVSNLQQGQQLCVDAAQAWVNAFSVIPVMDLPKIPGLHDMRDMQAATTFTFDVAADLLSAQREFAVQLTKVLLPAKTA